MAKDPKVTLKNQIKELEKQIKELTENLKIIQKKGCFSDRELQDKEFIIGNHMKKIQSLEKEKAHIEMTLRVKGN
ncbi:MAG: hypothetical protein HY730_04740 [Candidatus Tectomicrobia bacterium]|uniref:Uncharacterized protein n=1 Tax=Tectimicrobiota bacterium TaxID=2528274 RepID=A0A933GKR4_UNCTE|nr:hypothetical protein [Candidatus Tectomicrobia bacterium]